MPGISGIETIKKIRQINARVPIVVISSVGANQDMIFEAIKNGAKNIINKPFDTDLVKKILRAAAADQNEPG